MVELSKDIGAQIIEELDKLTKFIDDVKKQKEEMKNNFPKITSIIGEKKNNHLHLTIETSLYNNLKELSKSRGISLSDYCRRKLRGIY